MRNREDTYQWCVDKAVCLSKSFNNDAINTLTLVVGRMDIWIPSYNTLYLYCSDRSSVIFPSVVSSISGLLHTVCLLLEIQPRSSITSIRNNNENTSAYLRIWHYFDSERTRCTLPKYCYDISELVWRNGCYCNIKWTNSETWNPLTLI